MSDTGKRDSVIMLSIAIPLLIIILLVLFFSKDATAIAICVFFLIVGLVVVAIGASRYFSVKNYVDKAEAIRKGTKNLFTYNQSEKTLILLKRSSRISEYLKIEDFKVLNVQYEPLKVHVGAATVGGVTTGGAFTTGGNYYINGMVKSGKCNIMFGENTVNYLQLSDDMYDEALNSPISEFLNDKKQIEVEEKISPELSRELLKMDIEDIKTKGAMSNLSLIASAPTFEKANTIMNWITNQY